LRTIRRAYLDLSASSAGLRGPQSKRPRALDPAQGLEAWADVRWLTDRERDEVDLQTKAVLRRSMDRIRDLEAVEKGV
jgi:syntaxin 18